MISLPQGLVASGVASWAVRLANAMAERGRPVALVTHAEAPTQRRLDLDLGPAVRHLELTRLGPLDGPAARLGPLVAAYRDVLESLGGSADRPAILLPNLEAGSYAIAATLAASHGDRLRVLGWQHSDTAFDAALLAFYEPMLAGLVGVSAHIEGTLRKRLPARAGDVHRIPYGVEIAPAMPAEPTGPLRLVYAGRIEHEQKRVGVLCELAAELDRRGIEHVLTLVGDGPAAKEVDHRLSHRPNASRMPAKGRAELAELLESQHAFVLASRYEGLSVSMLEAMGHGLAPVVTRVASGAAEAIVDGDNGLLVEAERDEDEATIASRLADAIELLAGDPGALHRMRRRAHETVRDRFGIDVHADTCDRLFEAVCTQPHRWWPPERSVVFGASADLVGSGGVPHDAVERAAATLRELRGPVGVYGSGRHTRAIAAALADAPAEIACVIDDDQARHGRSLWGWPIVSLRDAAAMGVRDVLISSHMHRGVMAERCAAAGLRPIELYGEAIVGDG
ncbi:MAG: glycosyltransferase family 4 protein [Planctomycetota bacterium]